MSWPVRLPFLDEDEAAWGTCDWGGCDARAAMLAWDGDGGDWLPVCRRHSVEAEICIASRSRS